MNKFKDFLYNKNDIIVAVVILAAAAFIIYLKIGSIMHYPDTVAVAYNKAPTSAAVTETASLAATTAATSAAPTTTAATKPTTGAYRTVTIPSNAVSETVAQLLANAGLVSSAQSFEKDVEKYGMTGYIRAGTFKIPMGSTNKQIIEIITKKTIN